MVKVGGRTRRSVNQSGSKKPKKTTERGEKIQFARQQI
jgi:hypothetical protein